MLATSLVCAGRLPNLSAQSYEDDRIQVQSPAGWRVQQVLQTATGDKTFRTPIGGVLTRGRYRVYLLTHYGQTSGIEGGRFSDILRYVAPWMKVGDPWGCIDRLSTSVTPVTNDLSRVDLALDSRRGFRDKNTDCTDLHSRVQAPIWFGSYFSQPASASTSHGGYFLPFPLAKRVIDSPDTQMAFTATINTANAETLPLMNDRELNEFLRQASNLVSSITYK